MTIMMMMIQSRINFYNIQRPMGQTGSKNNLNSYFWLLYKRMLGQSSINTCSLGVKSCEVWVETAVQGRKETARRQTLLEGLVHMTDGDYKVTTSFKGMMLTVLF